MKHYVSFMGKPIDSCIKTQRGVQELLHRITVADQPSYGDILQFGYINRPKCVSIVGGEGIAYKVNCKGKTYILKAFNKCSKLNSEKKKSFTAYYKEVQSFACQTGCMPSFYDWAVVNKITKDDENFLILMQYINGRHLYKLPGEFYDCAEEEIGKLSLEDDNAVTANWRYDTLLNAKTMELCLRDYISQNNKMADMSAGEIQRFLNACNLIYKLGIYSKLDLIIKNIMVEDDRLYLIDPYWEESPHKFDSYKVDLNSATIINACKLLSPNNNLPNVVFRWLDDIDCSYLSSEQQKLLANLQVEFNKSLVAACTNVFKATLPMLERRDKFINSYIADELGSNVCADNDKVVNKITSQLGLEM